MEHHDSPNTTSINSMGHKEIMVIATRISNEHANAHSINRVVNHMQVQARVTIAWQGQGNRHIMQSEHGNMGIEIEI